MMIVVSVEQLHRGTFGTLDRSRLVGDRVVAVYIDIGLTDRANLPAVWQNLHGTYTFPLLETGFFYENIWLQPPDLVKKQVSRPDASRTIAV
ncbi:hypothetical protein QT971_08405 [Microcoleus sp. herbarium19]|uniref:hypothetical protein n=1 Tax=unclassified Microcoleus TaxID=2642155 RepID=UPI002FCFD86E